MTSDLQRVDQLTPAQRASLALRLRRAREGRSADQRIPRRPRGMVELPLTFMQEQLWFLDQLAPGSPTYNIPCAIRFGGKLDVETLYQALQRIMERHEILRTRFISRDGRPLQVVSERPQVTLSVVDLRAHPAQTRARNLEELRTVQARQPFALGTGGLLRAQLVLLRDDEQVLLLTVHHIVFDAWSYGVLLRELEIAYDAFAAGREPSLPELDVQYGDYALWQREWLQGDNLERLVAYWTKRLGGDLPIVAFPTDRPRPAVQSYRGDSLRRQWTGLAARVHDLARDESATVFATLLAAFFALLHRYTDQTDLVVGVPSANRRRTELEQLIGFFVNMLVIRVDVNGDPSFRELLARVRDAVLGAQTHQDLPFSKLVDVLHPNRDASRSPLFQISFTYDDTRESGARSLGGVSLKTEISSTGHSRFDLSMTIDESDEGLACGVEFSTDLFERDRIERFVGHLRTLLEAAVADPGARVSALPLLGEAERRLVVHDINQTAAPVPSACVHELFEQQVAGAPAATAAVRGDQHLTYDQLNREANQIARALHALDVSTDMLVGVCMDRSLRRLAGILGILKAGAGYVPLDPAYPPERLGFMLDDTAAPVVLVDAASRDRLPPRRAMQTLCLDDDWPLISAHDDRDLGPTANNRDVAYVIYTSGSTGIPKGVVIEHRSVANFVTSTRQLFAITPADTILQFASLNFDVSVFEMFTALTSGATLVLADTETLLSPMRLTQLMRDERVTVTDIPPAVMALLPADAFDDLRIVFVGGEAFSADLVDRWALPGRRFFNGYGPTEATVTVIVKECQAGLDGPPPIGRPMTNHQVYVLDRYGNPVPIGVPGELYIGGVGLARGYLRRVGLTRERFVPNPFSDDPDARLYKSGDVACFLPNGDLQFLGRVDDQVKIRGYRIELGEIAAVLMRHPAIAQAAVLVREDAHGAKELVAYATARDVPPERAAVREHLAAHLPTYMIPTHVVFLDALPLTRSGKLDRAALPPPEQQPAEDRAAPTTLTEAILANEIFADILGISTVGVNEGFFELGGNSLRAMQLLSRIRDTFGVELDVPMIFQAPTPAALAEVLRDRYGVSDAGLEDDALLAELEGISEEEIETLLGDPGAAATTVSPPVKPATAAAPASGILVPWPARSDGPPVAFVHPVSGSVLPYAGLAEMLSATFTPYGLQSAGLTSSATPHDTIEQMASAYVRALEPLSPARVCGWSMGGLVAFEMVSLLDGRGERVRLVMIDTGFPRPFGEEPDDTTFVRWFASDLAALGLGSFHEPDDFAHMNLAAQLGWMTAHLPFEDEATRAMWASQIHQRFAVFKANALAMVRYEPRPIAADVLVLKASESAHSTHEWERLVNGRFRVVELDGNHYQLLSPPLVTRVGELLAKHFGS
jgi:amino acid adenylation domain-containing protein